MAYTVKGTDFKTFDLPTMTKELQAYVLQMARFRQIVTKKDAIGTGKGISHRWFIPAPDPDVYMYSKYPDRDAFLQEGSYEIYSNQATVRELGYSMKYNTHDVDMSYLPIITYVRDILGRDCQRVIDYLVKTELDLTPWKYIPTSDYRGACTSLDSYLTTTTARNAFAAGDIGKIPLSERIYYGGWMGADSVDTAYGRKFDTSFPTSNPTWSSDNAVCLTPNPLTFVTRLGAHINGAYALGPYYSNLVAGKSMYPVKMSAVDSSYPDEFAFDLNYKPAMNWMHLFNMIMYAQRIHMYGFGKLGGDYILICSPAQAAHLYGSLFMQKYVNDTGTAGLRALINPTKRDDVASFLWGESVKIPLGLPVRIVIDNTGTLLEENWIEEGTRINQSGNDIVPFDKLIPTTFGARCDGARLFSYQTADSASEAVRSLATTCWPAWITPKPAQNAQTLEYGGRTVSERNSQTPTWTDTHKHQPPAISRRFPELGPCYLIGSSEQGVVQEILSMPEQVVKMSPLDFDRFGGMAWKMWSNYRATHIRGKIGWQDKNDGTEALWDSASIKNVISRMACIKFDYPIITEDTGATEA